MASVLVTKITHWLPIITFCPVNGLPDFIYVTITSNNFLELYQVRREVRKHVQFKKAFMEDIAQSLYRKYNEKVEVKVSLMFGRHTVIVAKNKEGL